MNLTKFTEGKVAARCIPIGNKSGATPKVGRMTVFASILSSVGLGGCVNVTAPSEPIVIELNINIQQEVIYRLAEDAGNTIEENPDIF